MPGHRTTSSLPGPAGDDLLPGNPRPGDPPGAEAREDNAREGDPHGEHAREAEDASEEELLARIDRERLPRHIAIIMDGNGRWARQRGLPRLLGHRQGHQSVRKIVRLCRDLGIGALTLYTFSSENWRRPEDEVAGLMVLIEAVLRMEADELHANQVRIRAIGRLDELPESLQAEIRRNQERTASNPGLQLNLAINYGARAEIVDAVRALVAGGAAPEAIDDDAISRHLYTAGQPDPDMVIRTGGDCRLSNFLLWQAAYAEIVVTDALWPEFGRADLLRAILDYQNRTRKFGAVVG